MTADGRAVPLAAPGDTLLADGGIVPGPHHQKPPCRHFPTCGGCTLQHVDDAAYADYLVDRIAGALGQQGLTAEIARPHLSPPRTRRRASLRAERIGRKILLGFNEGQSRKIVDLAECWILLPELFALLAPLRPLLAKLLADRRGCGVELALVDQGIDLLLTGVEADGLAAIEAINAFAEAHVLARVSVDGGYGAETRWEPRPVTVTLGGVAVGLPAGGFLQATMDGEAVLLASVRDVVGDAKTVADLFSGLGTFALPLSASAKVLSAEGARDAILSLKAAAARAGRQVVADHRDLFRRPYTAAELSRFGAVVLDPPRAGAKEQTTELAKAELRRIAYVSCNPSTFARDAKTLVDGGWRLEWIRPVGQFRWSTHVELAASFHR
ncbi:class I SAM-dependent RNA methyltransferase [Sphingomonas sp. CGMCC 1.13654]|uniref:Class I SAM-dependent RNA methyltransferase n=1 Tax=Sphingomonas chungangi TaxID=2683589 RepID=A0A838LBD6_9SPHN|nr:class I SAM-dependent RNA methyltransferase [Sphingomonas chungangi]MBA2936347.1 class I SAM-dependent RNA methyltransferase [Sphingomonas chungangi]MVW55732.1 class I SAM-dependent RNA methyltransferase [Sphingomonas chungangi]